MSFDLANMYVIISEDGFPLSHKLIPFPALCICHSIQFLFWEGGTHRQWLYFFNEILYLLNGWTIYWNDSGIIIFQNNKKINRGGHQMPSPALLALLHPPLHRIWHKLSYLWPNNETCLAFAIVLCCAILYIIGPSLSPCCQPMAYSTTDRTCTAGYC